MPFSEVAHDVWVARYEWFDVNVTVVRGGSGLLVVDTHASAEAAREVIDDVRALGAGDVVAVVNTHEHFDHVFGNGAFRTAYGDVPVHAHEVAAANTVASGERFKARLADRSGEPRVAGLLATEIVPADTTFSSAVALDVGDRLVELVHPGRGHTDGDLVVRVPDSDVVLAGDLVEESGPPGFGPDSHPMDWPLTLDIVLSLLTPASVVVPGHGAPVDRAFVEEQRNTIGIVAETIRDLATRGVPVAEALDAAEWPYPTDHLADAVRRGYEHLPRSQKRLPLV
ncbi:MAG TPA: MBL fold metallo-hydrolase [Nocardioides sp.]|uniref:MBL fold metallo-hydrolase n=1 Tax=Nocardioides sp. TaxID=35761 RepID=UPI002E368397|nr:MBL fold metallo-hydrolase [Nocardioides sp.]HEX5089177.1 MBL fold metallo-hydrolase [Nocardioides sp.]